MQGKGSKDRTRKFKSYRKNFEEALRKDKKKQKDKIEKELNVKFDDSKYGKDGIVNKNGKEKKKEKQ